MVLRGQDNFQFYGGSTNIKRSLRPMEENQGAEQTPLQFAIRAIGYFLCKTVLQTAENICFVKTTRHVKATKGSSKHQTTKFTTFKH